MVARGPGRGEGASVRELGGATKGEARAAGAQLSSRRRSMQLPPPPAPKTLPSPRPSVNDLRANDSHSLSLSRRPEPSSPPLPSRGSQFVYIGAGLLIAIDPHPSRPVGIRTAADGGEGEDRGRPSNLEEDRRLRR